MRVVHALVNLVAVAVLVGVPLLYLYLCRGTVTCAGQIPASLLIALGVVPVICFVFSAAVALLNWNYRLSRRLVMPAALLSAVATYVAGAAAALGYEMLVRPVLDDAVPAIVACTLVVGAWVPLTALWNTVLLLRALTSEPPIRSATAP
jgi:hypothetical protein